MTVYFLGFLGSIAGYIGTFDVHTQDRAGTQDTYPGVADYNQPSQKKNEPPALNCCKRIAKCAKSLLQGHATTIGGCVFCTSRTLTQTVPSASI
jgi:hypothetical protein